MSSLVLQKRSPATRKEKKQNKTKKKHNKLNWPVQLPPNAEGDGEIQQ